MAIESGNVLHPFFSKTSEKSGGEQTDEAQITTSGRGKAVGEHVDDIRTAPSRRDSCPSDAATTAVLPLKTAKLQATIGKAFKIEPLPVYDEAAEVLERPSKRRKVKDNAALKQAESVAVLEEQHASAIEPNITADGPINGPLANTPNIAGDIPTAGVQTEGRLGTTTPKKMLRLTASGKFSSPPTKPTKHQSMVEAQVKRRGRPRKAQDISVAKELVAIIRYRDCQTTGPKINAILGGHLRLQPHITTPKKKTQRKSNKQTHPFFEEKPKLTKQKIDSPRRTATSTPGKLRTQARPETQQSRDDHVFESALLKDRHIMKHPGAQDALWPPGGIAHVRVIDQIVPALELDLPRRKLKGVRRAIAYEESILERYRQRLEPEPEPALRSDGFREPKHDLVIPQRRLMSGVDISNTILKQVKATLRYDAIDELSSTPISAPVHPALEHVFSSIPTYSSGFDDLRGESSSLTTRSAPATAAEVLQPGSETAVLKTWLQALTVNSVGSTSSVEQDALPRRRKKRRRPADLDDFIVDENDDARSMVSLSDNESNPASSARSVVQTQLKGVRASNVLLISGPHGCGKTAAVYAVAKELKYRVFEISSAERRSGKDIVDKIGNVTENHMVKHHSGSSEDVEKLALEESERIDTAFAKDVESGRQGNLNAFFRPQAVKKTAKVPQHKPKVLNAIQKALKKPQKEQQQSLILLEEVDVLFKDDKEFWTTVLRLMISSKRPFVLTCNDEELVPLQTMQFHAILRFAPPATELAVDYILLVAAKEGHLLQRAAISHLWEATGHDLRQCLNCLDFWCRMGVGDIRDGLTWMYQRWPVGCDMDSKGRKLRVVSQGTFHSELAQSSIMTTAASSTGVRKDDLRRFEWLAAYLSDVDCFSSSHDFDPTLPDMPAKARNHYIDGLALLDVKPRIDHHDLGGYLKGFAIEQATHRSATTYSMPPTVKTLTRKAFACFDELAIPTYASSTPTTVESSVLDGPLASIAIDVAPYVRQIYRHDVLLNEQRRALAGPGKQARKTRAAMSALEGGQRQLVRRQWWWGDHIDLQPALATAGKTWAKAESAVRDACSMSRVGTPLEDAAGMPLQPTICAPLVQDLV